MYPFIEIFFTKIKDASKNKFLQNVVLVASGTAGGQAVTIAFAPLITRIYGPEAFGLLGTFVAVLAIATPVAALTYPVAIVLPKNDDDGRGVAKLSAILAFFVALVVATILLLFGDAIAALLNLQAISSFLLLIPVAMFFNALQQVMQQWLIRKKQFKIIARVAVSQSLMLNSSKVGVGLLHPYGAALVAVATLGNVFYAAQLWLGEKKWASKKDRIVAPVQIAVGLKQLAYEHKNFPFFRTPQVLVNALSSSVPVLILAFFFDTSVVGFFSLSMSVLAAPAMLIGRSFGSVFYPRIVEAIHRKQNAKLLLSKVMLLIVTTSVIPFLLIFLCGSSIFSFVFGEEWSASGDLASILSLSVFLGVVHRPCESVMYAYNYTKQYFYIEMAFTLILICGMYLFSSYGFSSASVVWTFTLVKSAYYLFIICFSYMSINRC